MNGVASVNLAPTAQMLQEKQGPTNASVAQISAERQERLFAADNNSLQAAKPMPLISDINKLDRNGDGKADHNELHFAKQNGVTSNLSTLLNRLLELAKTSTEGVKLSKGYDVNNPAVSEEAQNGVVTNVTVSGGMPAFIAANRMDVMA